MQIPKRKAEELRRLNQKTDYHVTQKTLENYKKKLEQLLKTDRPKTIDVLQRAQENGDLSENAEYQEAKWHLRRINSQIQNLEAKIKLAIIIESGPDASGRIQIGSTISTAADGKLKEFEIVGEAESDPVKGKISHLSPLGKTLLGHKAGDEIEFKAGEKVVIYQINEVR